MRKLSKPFLDIILRYIILVLAAIPNFWIFYFVFTPLTIYPTFWILGLFFEAILIKNVIIINNEVPIEIIKACIAGSAYYLLLILNLSTPKIKIKQRINLILLSFLALLIFNILRIVFLSVIFLEGFPGFVITHKFFWYFMSTIFVVIIWFTEVKIFKIKEIPFYSDFKFLYKNSLLKKPKKSKRS